MVAVWRPFLYGMGKLTASRRYDLGTFAAVKPWRVGRELAVQDLPAAKLLLLSETAILFSKNSLNLRLNMEEQEGKRVIKINLLQVSMTLGTYLGVYIILVYLVSVMAIKHAALSLLALPLIVGIPVVAFFLIRRFRDSTQAPFFPFPISWMISILTFLFATVLSCMVAYLYLRFIDNGALASGLMARMEEMMAQSDAITSAFTDPAQVERYNSTMELFRQSVTWFCSLPASGVAKQLIQTSLLWGNILSLFIGLLTAKRIRLK